VKSAQAEALRLSSEGHGLSTAPDWACPRLADRPVSGHWRRKSFLLLSLHGHFIPVSGRSDRRISVPPALLNHQTLPKFYGKVMTYNPFSHYASQLVEGWQYMAASHRRVRRKMMAGWPGPGAL